MHPTHCLRFILAFFALGHLSASEWFVAPSGDDKWSGKLPQANAEKTDGPFATLEHARDTVRAEKGQRTVRLRGGIYSVPNGLVLEAQDSGTAEAPVLWEAFEKEQPVLIGGRPITDWKPWKDGILQADVSVQGFKGIVFKQLLFNGNRQPLARYPNFDPQNPYGGGWAYAGGEMWPPYTDKEGEDKHTLKVKTSDLRKWARPEEVEVFILPRFNWRNDIVPVKSIDAGTATVTTAQDTTFAMRANDRFFFQGALEELDAPGEWYLDREAWTVYFKPPAPIESGAVLAPTTRDILTLNGTDYVTLRGLTFECAARSAIVLAKANHCRILGCTVRNVSGYLGTGINVTEGTDNGIVGCDIHHIGGDAVALSGGDRQTLTAAGNFVDNCYIHHVGVLYKQGVGVLLDGVGQRVSHCLIHDTPRFGIMFAGNNHVLEYNHLRHIALETQDVGATYCRGLDWISPRGTVIRYNYIHDVLGYGWNGKWISPYFSWGIYLDDNSSGLDIFGNIVVRCGRALIHGHNAHDCRVFNNIFVEGGERQWEFNGWTVKHGFWVRTLPQMVQGYESVANLPAWKSVRGMDVPPLKIADSEGRVMAGNIFTRNIISWKNPEANALNVLSFNGTRNQFDYNLYWHGGLPLKTSLWMPGKVTGRNLAPNPNFAEGPLNKMPKDWNLQTKPKTDNAARNVMDGGKHALHIDASFDHEKTSNNFPIVTSRDIELKPGTSYRLHARLRSDQAEAKAGLAVQFFLAPKDGQPGHYWLSSPSEAKVTNAWQDFEFAVRIPAKGETGWHESMKLFRIRIDWSAEQGVLFATDLSLAETAPLDEWQAWQALGGDHHSVIVDPKFVAPEKDDYRLAPTSPAWPLGFKPIPTEKIGPYASPDRASWPIVEAEGAREHPLPQ